VERAKPFTGMVGKFDEESFQSISNRQEAFVVAVGLALAGMGEVGAVTRRLRRRCLRRRSGRRRRWWRRLLRVRRRIE
jgi:hypothetical protein